MSPPKPESTEPSPTSPEPQGGDARRFTCRSLFGASAGGGCGDRFSPGTGARGRQLAKPRRLRQRLSIARCDSEALAVASGRGPTGALREET
jgi:hypothetical protein